MGKAEGKAPFVFIVGQGMWEIPAFVCYGSGKGKLKPKRRRTSLDVKQSQGWLLPSHLLLPIWASYY